jgi:hypothetical protein
MRSLPSKVKKEFAPAVRPAKICLGYVAGGRRPLYGAIVDMKNES